jgi:hypothetical protein
MNYALIRDCVRITASLQLSSQGAIGSDIVELLAELDAMLAPIEEEVVAEEAPAEEAPAEEAPADEVVANG